MSFKKRHLFFVIFLLLSGTSFVRAGVKHYDTTFSGNYGIPEHQDGFLGEEYDLRAGHKLERGLKNFFLGWLEIPQGVKMEVYRRKMEYLPVGIESYPLGILKGVYKGVGRMTVGLYEMVTFAFAQPPIIEEMEDWLY